jgi:hypothetical protein
VESKDLVATTLDQHVESAMAEGLDVAALMLLEPQVKALKDAIEAAMPAIDRLMNQAPDVVGALCNNLQDAVDTSDGCPIQGSLAAILDNFSEFTAVLLVGA